MQREQRFRGNVSKLHTWLRRRTRFLPYEQRLVVLEQLSRASSPNFDFFILVVLSTMIATLGLITDSAAVIIGAMLVAPLMSPILGLSLASVAGEQYMFRRALGALVRGALLAVALSAGLSWLARVLPFDVLTVIPAEVLARTRPTPFDLGVALAGGAAAAYALAQPSLSAALPGVAIATALLPPLCTVGIGISLQDGPIALGALLLFLTNLFTISFAGIIVFAALGFRPRNGTRTRMNMSQGIFVSTGLVMMVTFPLVGLTLRFVEQARQDRASLELQQVVQAAVAAELHLLPEAQLVEVISTPQETGLHLAITVRTPRSLIYREIKDFQEAVAARLQREIAVEIIAVPMIRLDPLIPPTQTPTPTPGPSATPTHTPTPTRTPVPPTATPTETSTPTVTPTATQTFTPTPVLAYIANSGGKGILVRAAPAGEITGSIPEGAPVNILYRRENLDGQEWIEIRDLLGRTGWVLDRFLIIKP